MTRAFPAAERRRFRLSLAAVAVALPAAIAVHSWESVAAWRAENGREPIPVDAGGAQTYAGAEWRLTRLSALDGGSPGRAVILAEFEAAVADPGELAESPCQVMLTDDKGRRWHPAFMTEPIVRELHPETADRPRCGSPAFQQAAKGRTVRMAESFVVPSDAEDLTLLVTVASGLPRYLAFSQP